MGTVSDEVCREEQVPSELAMQAHSAPLGIAFYKYSSVHPHECTGAFPESMYGHAFITFHGSWNRDVPTGYRVVCVKRTEDGQVDSSLEDPIFLLARASDSARWNSGYRPVYVDFGVCGRLLVTSDGTRGRGSNVVRIAYGSDASCGDVSDGY